MLEGYYRIGQAVGISIQLLPDGGTIVHACEVLVKNNQLDVVKKVVDLTELKALKQHFPDKIPMSMSFFGKGVLVKQVPKTDDIDARNFAQILPNANIADFYIQHFISGENSFVSVVRKADAEKWIQALSEIGFTTLMLSLGAFPVDHILKQVNVYDESLLFDGHVVQFNAEREWAAYRYAVNERSQFPLKIGSSAIDEKLLIPYATAFQLALYPDIEPIVADVDHISENLTTYVSNKKFQTKGFITLVVFFLLLLVNFVAFSTLSSSNDEMASRLSVSVRSASDMQGIVSQIADKEADLKVLGWDGGMNKSAMVDQLAALLPNDVQLIEIAVNPVEGNVRGMQRSLTFMDRTIKITGHSDSIIPVNEWIARVGTLKWVKNIQMNGYTLDRETNTGRFIIVIKY